VLEPEVVALIESGCATLVGTVDGAGNPTATYAMGTQVLEAGIRLRVVLNAEEPQVMDDLRTTGVVAVGFTDVPTLRSFQVKGRMVLLEPVTVDDRLRTDRHLAAFFEAIHVTDGTPIELLQRMVPRELVALVTTVEELYDQTPGPQAGMSLSRA
jgi:hypothetical protein